MRHDFPLGAALWARYGPDMFKYRFPYARPGARIGLLGGSFDPPHAGHILISKTALRAFGLDAIWWLVAPANPLKDNPPADLRARLSAAKSIVTGSRIQPFAIEADLGTRYTADTLHAMQRLYPASQFIWLMGGDNMLGFHRWDRWQQIAHSVPIGVISRPQARARIAFAPAARALQGARRYDLRALVGGPLPAWGVATGPLSAESSTRIRGQGLW